MAYFGLNVPQIFSLITVVSSNMSTSERPKFLPRTAPCNAREEGILAGTPGKAAGLAEA